MKKRNPVAAALRSPSLRKQVVSGKRRKNDRKALRAKLKPGKIDRVDLARFLILKRFGRLVYLLFSYRIN